MRLPSDTKYRDEQFIIQAMDKWSRTVFTLAFAQTASIVDAEDLHQEVFMRLFKSTTDFADDEHLKAWLLRVTINCCRDLVKSGWNAKVTTVERLESFTSENEPRSIEASANTELAQALEQLPIKTRAIVHLYYYEGYSGDEISQIMQINASTVRTRLERARKQLKTLLGGAESHEFLQK